MNRFLRFAFAGMIILVVPALAQSGENKNEAVINFDSGIGNQVIEEKDPNYNLYKEKYFAHYHALGNEVAPALQNFREELDAQGHPKWFDGAYGFYTLKMLVIRLFVNEKFDDLEKLISDWTHSDIRSADGSWKLSAFPAALEMRFKSGTWNQDLQIIKHWQEKYPKSAAASIAEAWYWNCYAWNARGDGFSNSVSAEGWKLFKERMDKAEKILVDSHAYASDNPEWYAQYLMIAKYAQWPKDKFLKLAELSSQEHRFYYHLYTVVVGALTPSWGGNWKSLDDYIGQVVTHTKDKEGTMLYARLYISASQCPTCNQNFNLFRDTHASWPKMKKSFEDLMKFYPHSLWNLNRFASFACQAGDKKTFQSIRFLIGNNIIQEAWRSNYSLDLCEHQFPMQKL